MEQIKFIYLVVDREYMKSTFSTIRAFKWARDFDDVMKALNYILNSDKQDLIIITMLETEYLVLKERNERLCI